MKENKKLVQIDILNLRTTKKLDFGFASFVLEVSSNLTYEDLDKILEEVNDEYKESYPDWFEVEQLIIDKINMIVDYAKSFPIEPAELTLV